MGNKRTEIRLTKENYEYLSRLKSENKTSINEIINAIISDKVNENNGANFQKLTYKNNFQENHRIYIKVSDNEMDFLKEQGKKHGLNSATKEVKFIILNSIYDRKIFDKIDMKELTFAVNSMNKLGRQVYSLCQAIRSSNQIVNLNPDSFKSMLDLIDKKITQITNFISSYDKILQRRI